MTEERKDDIRILILIVIIVIMAVFTSVQEEKIQKMEGIAIEKNCAIYDEDGHFTWTNYE